MAVSSGCSSSNSDDSSAGAGGAAGHAGAHATTGGAAAGGHAGAATGGMSSSTGGAGGSNSAGGASGGSTNGTGGSSGNNAGSGGDDTARPGWVLAWSDEFNGQPGDRLDKTKWDYQNGPNDANKEQEEPAFSILSLTEVRPRSRSSNSSLSKMRKTSERDQIRACLFLTALRRSSERKEDLSGLTPLDFVQYPARLSYENGGDTGPTLRAIRLAFR